MINGEVRPKEFHLLGLLFFQNGSWKRILQRAKELEQKRNLNNTADMPEKEPEL